MENCGPLSSRAYCIFAQLTNSNVLGLAIHPWLEQLGNSNILHVMRKDIINLD